MRTKALLALAAMAIAIPASAQVYSANIVGYVNVPIAGNNALTLVSNPLKPANGDYNITNTIPTVPDGASLFKWTGTDWFIPSYIEGLGWLPDAEVALGEAVFIQSPAAATITFVGEVSTGENTTTLLPGLNLVAPKVPVAEAFPGAANGNDGDSIFLYDGAGWGTIWSYIEGLGWLGDVENPDGPVIPVGGGLFYQNVGTDNVVVTRTFNP